MSLTKDLLINAQAVLRQNLGGLFEHLQDPSVQEVMINHPSSIWIERNGVFQPLDLTIAAESLDGAIHALANINGKGVKPILDCRLPGLRIAATLPPISTEGPSMCIRRHSSRVFTLDDYVQAGSFNNKVAARDELQSIARPSDELTRQGGEHLKEFFIWLMQSQKNFVISGSTSSGKTALLNALTAHIPAHHRVVTIEDPAELQLPHLPNKVSFEVSQLNGIGIRELVRHTLRYRPNRILVGEIRGAEAFDMLDAYNTGHPGSAVSFHSDTAAMALSRLENMVRMAPEASNWPLADLRRQIASTFSFVVHGSILQGQRGPVEVMEILGYEEAGYVTRSLFSKQITHI